MPELPKGGEGGGEKKPEEGDKITKDDKGNKKSCKKEKGNKPGECKDIPPTEVAKNNNGVELTSSTQPLGAVGNRYTHKDFRPSPEANSVVGVATRKRKEGTQIVEDVIKPVKVGANAKEPQGKFTSVPPSA